MKKYRKTKLICLLFLLCFAALSARAFQNDGAIRLPEVEDVQKIETTNNKFRFQTPESLLRMLPHLTAYAPGKGKSQNYQYGTILLKDGSILKWRSSNPGNVTFYNDETEQFYFEDTSFWSDFWASLFTF